MLEHPRLTPITRALNETKVVPFGDTVHSHRTQDIAESVASGEIREELVRVLLQVADVGICGLSVREDQITPELAEFLRRFKNLLSEEPEGDAGAQIRLSEEQTEMVVRNQTLYIHHLRREQWHACLAVAGALCRAVPASWACDGRR